MFIRLKYRLLVKLMYQYAVSKQKFFTFLNEIFLLGSIWRMRGVVVTMAIKLSKTASDLLREIMDNVIAEEGEANAARVIICGELGQCMLVELRSCEEPDKVCIGFRYGGVLSGERMRKLREFLFLEFDLVPRITDCSQWVQGSRDEMLDVLKAVAEKFLTSTDYEVGVVAEVRQDRRRSIIYILGTDRKVRKHVVDGVIEQLRLKRRFLKKFLELKLVGGKTVSLPLSDSEEPLIKAIIEGEFLTLT